MNRKNREGYPVNTEYAHVYFPYAYIPQSKRGKKAKACFNITQRTNITITVLETSIDYSL